MQFNLPESWKTILESEMAKPYFYGLQTFINGEYSQYECFPNADNIFRALQDTSFEDTKIVILGQDPYHTPGAAMGLSFSIPNGSKVQPSLRNIFKELESDIGILRTNTDLTDWTKQGVLLLNSVLTVRSGLPASHAGKGWENFTDQIISLISSKKEGVVFILWGNYAISKSNLIDGNKHLIIATPHPSPFSAYRGFFGSKPFSKINTYLIQNNMSSIDWK
ncbi:uracil-DNA glycosylase [Candidatus Gracilibacteria bacterium]|nr:uracil-DNA glycosylase [Candidatus Gracilibacteria bacterium]